MLCDVDSDYSIEIILLGINFKILLSYFLIKYKLNCLK